VQNQTTSDLEKAQLYRSRLYLLALLLLPPALLINLGLLTFIDDEGIRSLVALEMKLSNNLITPTLHGEYYYNKPPLYNWILLAFFSLTGKVNEFVARFPTVLALIGFAATVYYFVLKHYSRRIAFLNAFFLITCGRILFWDSMLALIDTCFSWVMFTLFMVVYHEMERERYGRLFLFSYLLGAVGFLLKGLPAVVFLGITLTVYFFYRRKFKAFFSWQHVLGGLVFLFILGTYYLTYHQYNSLETVLATLVNESSKRTVVNYGAGRTVLHFFSFPFEMVYHFLPWTLMVLFFLRRGSWDRIRQDSFIIFNLITLGANVVVYWLSPEVYPRYLLMLLPLMFSTLIHVWDTRPDDRHWTYRLFFGLLGFAAVLFTLGSLAPLFWERIQWVPYVYLKSILLFGSMFFLTAQFFYRRSLRLELFIVILLVFRIGFDWFVLPDRNAHDYGDLCRASSREAGAAYADQDLYVYWETGAVPISSFYLQPTNSFYLTQGAGKIIPLRLKEDCREGDLLVIDPRYFPNVRYEQRGEIKARHERKVYHVGRFIR
jgi:4-amino-4-deoxy-L-arabinose transferase-like glycosyltransferase